MAPKRYETIPKVLDCIQLELPITHKRPGEVWKQVPGYPDFQASSLGRIRSVRVRIIKPCRNYKTLSDDPQYEIVSIGNRKVLVQRMVAAAFAGKAIPASLKVHHKDNDKANNRADNLEVVTHAQNIKYAYDDGIMPSKYKLNLLQREKIVELFMTGDYLINDIAKCFPMVHRSTIAKTLKDAGCPMHFCKKVPPKLREEIRSRYVPKKVSMRQLAQEYGLSEGTIENIVTKRPGGRRAPRPQKRAINNTDNFFDPPETESSAKERRLRELIKTEYQIKIPLDGCFGPQAMRENPEASELYQVRVPNHAQELSS